MSIFQQIRVRFLRRAAAKRATRRYNEIRRELYQSLGLAHKYKAWSVRQYRRRVVSRGGWRSWEKVLDREGDSSPLILLEIEIVGLCGKASLWEWREVRRGVFGWDGKSFFVPCSLQQVEAAHGISNGYH